MLATFLKGASAPTKKAVEFISSAAASNVSSISAPAHLASDMIVFVNGGRTSTPPALSAGCTNMGTISASAGASGQHRSARVQYRFGTGASLNLGCEYYGIIFVLRNAKTVGVSVFTDDAVSEATLTHPLAAMESLAGTGKELVLGAGFVSGIVSTNLPWLLTPTVHSGARAGVYIPNNTNTSLAADHFTVNGATRPIVWQAEFRP